MTTFFELRKGLESEKRKKFLKQLAKRRKTGSSGKELWKWIPGLEGKYKVSNRGRIKRVRVQCPTGGGEHSKKALENPERLITPINGWVTLIRKGKKRKVNVSKIVQELWK